MMFWGASDFRSNRFHTEETTFRLRPYNDKLNEMT